MPGPISTFSRKYATIFCFSYKHNQHVLKKISITEPKWRKIEKKVQT
jgi:hypothetical protein